MLKISDDQTLQTTIKYLEKNADPKDWDKLSAETKLQYRDTILGYLKELKSRRDKDAANRKTQLEGIKKAVEAGKIGRPRKKVVSNFDWICEQHMEGKITIEVAAKCAKLSKSIFCKRYKEYKERRRYE